MSIFDRFKPDDLLLAFFPCTRFEAQFNLWMIGKSFSQSSWPDRKKLEYALQKHSELCVNYEVITKLVLVCMDRGLKLIIENPHSKPHYLNQWWPLEPSWIDKDRTKRGDNAVKPTQYWFVNCQPEHNFVLEPQALIEETWLVKNERGINRSLITKDYANRFIKEFIL